MGPPVNWFDQESRKSSETCLQVYFRPSFLDIFFIPRKTNQSWPSTYWHEYLDIIFFFKVVNGLIDVNPDVIPTLRHSTRTRSSCNNLQYFVRNCKTSTFQKSFFNRTVRIWNTLVNDLDNFNSTNVSTFRTTVLNYYFAALQTTYNPDDPRTWKTICLKCNSARSLLRIFCCF